MLENYTLSQALLSSTLPHATAPGSMYPYKMTKSVTNKNHKLDYSKVSLEKY